MNTYKIPVTSMKDPPNLPLQTFNALGIRETAFLVDLATMKILQVINGSVFGAGDSAVKQAIPRMMQLLGNKGG